MLSNLSLGLLCLLGLLRRLVGRMTDIIEGLPGNVVAEVTRNLITSRTRVLVVLVYRLASCYGKLSSQTVLQL